MKTNINFPKASFKDFENIPDLNAFERAEVFQEFTNYMEESGQMNLIAKICDWGKYFSF